MFYLLNIICSIITIIIIWFVSLLVNHWAFHESKIEQRIDRILITPNKSSVFNFSNLQNY
jgi:hypothetical protein